MTNLPQYLERGLTAIAYGDEGSMRQWQEEHDPGGHYPNADAEDLRIHIARRLLVLAETPVMVMPRRAHGHPEGCQCETCQMIAEAYRHGKELQQVETF
jgi:hypothetical protein